MSELLDVTTSLATWLVYVSAAIMMLGAIVAAVLAGFAVRFVAVVLREIIYERREEGGPDASTDAFVLQPIAKESSLSTPGPGPGLTST